MYAFQDIWQRGQQQEHSRNRFGTAQKELRQIQMEGTYSRLICPPVVRIIISLVHNNKYQYSAHGAIAQQPTLKPYP